MNDARSIVWQYSQTNSNFITKIGWKGNNDVWFASFQSTFVFFGKLTLAGVF